MKKSKLSLALTIVLMLAFGLSQAATPTPTTNPGGGSLKHFKFPSILLNPAADHVEKTYKVEVLFTTDHLGKVNFVLVKTDNKELRSEIEKQFYNLALQGTKENVVQKVILNFKIV